MNNQDYQKDLASIRTLMERSIKFISLSGVSGILAGTYSWIGAYFAYRIIYSPSLPVGYKNVDLSDDPSHITLIAIIATIVLLASVGTGVFLSWRKAKRMGQSLWNATSRLLLFDLSVTLGVGGLFCIILFVQEYYLLLAPSLLLFYGLALMNGSRHTFSEIKYLGLTEIILGLLALVFPEYGLVAWTVGFGAMHIIYGSIMYFRHEQ